LVSLGLIGVVGYLKVKILIEDRAVVLYFLHEGPESFLVSEVVRVIEFGKSERVSKYLHILPVLPLYRQLH